MGKMITFLSILIFIDLMFLVTGQLSGTLTSMIFQVVLDPSAIQTSSFWAQLMGSAGIAGFLSLTAVTVGFIVTRSDTILFSTIGIALANLTIDFVTIYNILRVHSPVLSTFVMAPIIIMYLIVVADWVRGRD